MDVSNRTRKQPAARGATRRLARPSQRGGAQTDRRSPEGLTIAIHAVPLPDPETNPLRAQQLAVIVDLLRRAAAEAAGKDAASPDSAEPPK